MIQKNMFQCLLNEMPITDLQDLPTKQSAKYLGNHFHFQSVSLKINICLTEKVAQCFFSWILYNRFCYFVPAWTHAWTVSCGIQAAEGHLQRSLLYNNYLPHPFPFVFHASRQTAEAHTQFYKVTKSKLTSHNSDPPPPPPPVICCVCVCVWGVTIFVSKQVTHRLYFHFSPVAEIPQCLTLLHIIVTPPPPPSVICFVCVCVGGGGGHHFCVKTSCTQTLFSLLTCRWNSSMSDTPFGLVTNTCHNTKWFTSAATAYLQNIKQKKSNKMTNVHETGHTWIT